LKLTVTTSFSPPFGHKIIANGLMFLSKRPKNVENLDSMLYTYIFARYFKF